MGAPGLTEPPATTASMEQQPAPRFTQGEQVTIIITAPVDSEWDAIAHGGRACLMLGVRLPNGRLLSIPADYPGIRVIHGDLTQILGPAFTDALSYHDEGECGWPGHEFLTAQYERGAEIFDPKPVLAAVEVRRPST